MIQKTFCFLPKVGPGTEAKIKAACSNWDEFLNTEFSFLKNKSEHDDLILKAKAALIEKNSRFFSVVLPSNESWRLLDHFDKICYVDIETTGLSKDYHQITTMCLYDGNAQNEVKTWINGQNMSEESLRAEFSKYDLIVTFNGKMFDVPFINAKFPSVMFDMPHVDLRWVLKRAGYSGGLKKIEKDLGIDRGAELEGVDGFEAVRLWKRYKRGDQAALDLLVRYNQEDVINLKELARIACNKLKE